MEEIVRPCHVANSCMCQVGKAPHRRPLKRILIGSEQGIGEEKTPEPAIGCTPVRQCNLLLKLGTARILLESLPGAELDAIRGTPEAIAIQEPRILRKIREELF